MKKIVGTMRLGNKVDITDPCYTRDVWCRMNDVEIVPGTYECYADVWDDKKTNGWGNRVARIGIRKLASGKLTFRKIETIGVDAGMAGFYSDKPDFTEDEWSEFCNIIRDEYPCIHLHDGELQGRLHGFTTSSGYGDGGYPVYAAKNAEGKIIALEIRFL